VAGRPVAKQEWFRWRNIHLEISSSAASDENSVASEHHGVIIQQKGHAALKREVMSYSYLTV
jgi:hypothetical protein